MTTQRSRYAIYFAPPASHPLWDAGCNWLGRHPHIGCPAAAPRCAQVGEPWRYGFHATLKAPFALRSGATEADLVEAVADLAAGVRRFVLPPLRVARLSRFLALRPIDEFDEASCDLRRLADRCVTELDIWRAPLSDAERERRMDPGFTERQRLNVLEYGYGHVLDDWRFHMTLSNDLSSTEAVLADELRNAAEQHFEQALSLPLVCQDLCVFLEPAPGVPFVLLHRLPLKSV